MSPGGQEGQWYAAVHKKSAASRLKGGDPPLLLFPGEITFEILCSVLGSSIQERQGTAGERLAEGHKDDCGLDHFPRGERLRGVVLLSLESSERSYLCL